MNEPCIHETGPWPVGVKWPRCLKCEIERLTRELLERAQDAANYYAEIERLRAALEERTPELITYSLAINLETYLNQGDAPMDRKGRQLAEEALARYKALRPADGAL